MKSPIPSIPLASRLNLTILFVNDPHQEGVTAYFLEYPNVIVKGSSRRQATANLFAAFSDIINSGRLELNFQE